jgi:hypothetical protein
MEAAMVPARGLILDAGILQGLEKEKPPHTPLANWLNEKRRQGVRLVTIREVTAECIDVRSSILERLGVLIEASKSPPDPQGLLQAFSGGTRAVSFNEELPRADRSLIAHAIAGQYDVVTTDWRMRQRSYKQFLARLDRLHDRKLPLWRLPQFHLADRGFMHSP